MVKYGTQSTRLIEEDIGGVAGQGVLIVIMTVQRTEHVRMLQCLLRMRQLTRQQLVRSFAGLGAS